VRQVPLNFIPEGGTGDCVIVHVGFAIGRVDAPEAECAYHLETVRRVSLPRGHVRPVMGSGE
jgi:hydrogenase maturation factor